MAQKKVLAIDDEAEILKVITARLEANGYQVVSASNGEDGLRMVEAEKPDLIILDIMMPQMDGYTFVREYRSRYSEIKTPIIVLTAKEKMKDLFEMEGVKDYVTKPYDASLLLEKIKEHIGT